MCFGDMWREHIAFRFCFIHHFTCGHHCFSTVRMSKSELQLEVGKWNKGAWITLLGKNQVSVSHCRSLVRRDFWSWTYCLPFFLWFIIFLYAWLQHSRSLLSYWCVLTGTWTIWVSGTDDSHRWTFMQFYLDIFPIAKLHFLNIKLTKENAHLFKVTLTVGVGSLCLNVTENWKLTHWLDWMS